MIMMGLFLFLAIALSVVIFGIALFGSWIYLKREYLRPLRDDVGKLKEEVPRIDERTKQMDGKLDMILNKAKIKF